MNADEVINLKATAEPGAVRLTWDVSSTDYLQSFLIVVTQYGAVKNRLTVAATAREATVTCEGTGYEFNVEAIVAQGGKIVTANPLPQPVEPPPPPTSGAFIRGLNAGNWGSQSFTDIAAAGIKNVRLEYAEAEGADEAAGYGAQGVSVSTVIFGTSESENYGVAATVAAQAVAYFKRFGKGGTFWEDNDHDYGGLRAEMCNEPKGTNYTGFVALCKAVHEAFAANFAEDIRPKVLVPWGSETWFQGIRAAGVLAYADEMVSHAYGGDGGQYGGALGNRKQIELIHAQTGLPVAVTEVGWPTDTGGPSTGDSQQWTEAQQAENIAGLMAWGEAQGVEKVSGVWIYEYIDQESPGPNQYGVEKRNREHKPGFAAIGAL
jgi:hypothetical protein